MKDFLNFEITAQPDGTRVRHIMRHKKKDGIIIEFTTDLLTKASDIERLIKNTLKSWAAKYSSKTRRPLTPKQKVFYYKLCDFYKTDGRPPTYEEMLSFGPYVSKGTPHAFVKKLSEKGWVWADEDGLVIPMDVAAPEMTEY